jgi:hypothetical protein
MSRDEWWLDYIEGEIDAETRAEMKALLRSSGKDQELVKSISDTKTLLKEAPEEPKFSDTQLDALHDRIMAGIEDVVIEAPPKLRVKLRPEVRRYLRAGTMTLVFALLGLSLARHLSHESPNTQWDVSQQMAQHGHENPDELAQLMTYQNETDFFVDVASQSLDHLTKEQFETLLQSTRKTR